jgi:hypothetical protein
MTDQLITRLAAANPVPHDGPLEVPKPVRVQATWKIAVSAIVATAALALAGIAIADGLGVFSGISAVQHPQTTGDEIDPATKAYIERTNCTQPNGQPCAPMITGLQFDTARHLGQLPDGQNIYVIAGTGDQNYLYTVVGPPHAEFEGPHSPLSKSHPSTIGTYLSNDHSFTFGVALDGATSVSFLPKSTADGTPTGQPVTVPVKDNFWIYETPADLDDTPIPLQPLTVHFADGTSVTMPATRTNCAAC